jgi:hypothetical protein
MVKRGNHSNKNIAKKKIETNVSVVPNVSDKSPNKILITEFTKLVERTREAIDYYKNKFNPQGSYHSVLQFKLLTFERALNIISNSTGKIKHGNDLLQFKGIGEGILRRVDTILKLGYLPDAYPEVPIYTIPTSVSSSVPASIPVSVPVSVPASVSSSVPVGVSASVPASVASVPASVASVASVPVSVFASVASVASVSASVSSRMDDNDVIREPEIGKARSKQTSDNSISQLIAQNQYLIENLVNLHKREIEKEKVLSKVREKYNIVKLLYLQKENENQELLKKLNNYLDRLI